MDLVVLGVGLLGQTETQWPPLTDNPFKADSISNFWARRWHQMLRRTFIVMGGIPGGWIAGRPGAVLGTFIASGLFHEFGAYAIGRGIDHTVTLFFAVQGVAVILERLWHRWTGYYVRGWGGRAWAYLVMVPLGQICCELYSGFSDPRQELIDCHSGFLVQEGTGRSSLHTNQHQPCPPSLDPCRRMASSIALYTTNLVMLFTMSSRFQLHSEPYRMSCKVSASVTSHRTWLSLC